MSDPLKRIEVAKTVALFESYVLDAVRRYLSDDIGLYDLDTELTRLMKNEGDKK